MLIHVEREKKLAAEASVALVADGMQVGLGTGSTVAYMLPALGAAQLDITCVATSPATENLAVSSGLTVVPFDHLDRLDIAIDGADQVDGYGWLVKGGGGAHTREKIVAASAERFIVIVSTDKLVGRVRAPLPLELSPFGLSSTLSRLAQLGQVTVRTDALRTPDGGVLADYVGAIDDPQELSAQLSAVPGLVSHGLFPPAMVERVLVGRGTQVEVMEVTPGA